MLILNYVIVEERLNIRYVYNEKTDKIIIDYDYSFSITIYKCYIIHTFAINLIRSIYYYT